MGDLKTKKEFQKNPQTTKEKKDPSLDSFSELMGLRFPGFRFQVSGFWIMLWASLLRVRVLQAGFLSLLSDFPPFLLPESQ